MVCQSYARKVYIYYFIFTSCLHHRAVHIMEQKISLNIIASVNYNLQIAMNMLENVPLSFEKKNVKL